VRAVILLFPGTNRERDMALALERATGRAPKILFHRETALPAGADLVVLPGGFSHGDYLRCGAMAARSPIMPAVRDFAAAGGHVLGVCNGFQILTEAGLLPGALLRNAGLRFLAMDCHLRVENAATPYTRGYAPGDVFACPMAHGDGNYFADDATLDMLEGEGRVVFRYCDATGAVTEAANRNGAARGIAGIVSANRRVLGLMPHPENATDALMGGTGGAALFAGLAGALAA
jgi:phosphoribosylformylglycinamidine synthase subunit PurQ / glutaminase